VILKHNYLIQNIFSTNVHQESESIINKLNMIELFEEGGYYRETYRSDKHIVVNCWDDKSQKDTVYYYSNHKKEPSNIRSISTLIYYLLDGEQFSAFHKVKHDEIWHFYKGSSVSLYILTDSKNFLNIQIGNDLDNNETIQYVIKGDTWFGAEINDKSLYSLVGCSVSPGFDFRDFELGERDNLKKLYPQHEYLINKLTRK
jgi:predicted cupin superfamily sugar epimerase